MCTLLWEILSFLKVEGLNCQELFSSAGSLKVIIKKKDWYIFFIFFRLNLYDSQAQCSKINLMDNVKNEEVIDGQLLGVDLGNHAI